MESDVLELRELSETDEQTLEPAMICGTGHTTDTCNDNYSHAHA